MEAKLSHRRICRQEWSLPLMFCLLFGDVYIKYPFTKAFNDNKYCLVALISSTCQCQYLLIASFVKSKNKFAVAANPIILFVGHLSIFLFRIILMSVC